VKRIHQKLGNVPKGRGCAFGEDQSHSDEDTGHQVEQHVSGLHVSIFSEAPPNQDVRCAGGRFTTWVPLIAFAGRLNGIRAFQMLPLMSHKSW
jgi:hypothetical protein